MAVVEELLRAESDGTISFGNHTLAAKAKLEDYEHGGNLYKVKTFKELTKLEKNGMFAYESEPGPSVNSFRRRRTASPSRWRAVRMRRSRWASRRIRCIRSM